MMSTGLISLSKVRHTFICYSDENTDTEREINVGSYLLGGLNALRGFAHFTASVELSLYRKAVKDGCIALHKDLGIVNLDWFICIKR